MKTQHIYLEHANITVNNLESSITFFKTAFPDFVIRGGGDTNGRKWIHLGNEITYIALNESAEQQMTTKDYSNSGINHLGFVVEDVEIIAERLLAAGFKRDYPKQIENYRIRDYFADTDGNQYEFVQYLSDKISERNYYDA
ncbi:MAG: VOC family protein [Crocinitomicaceae bacterium]|nr:VOC family protein [Flavobacteriales bacterium]NQZ34249.1 VOC family protein [Crocinitomicaceae bacterium]